MLNSTRQIPESLPKGEKNPSRSPRAGIPLQFSQIRWTLPFVLSPLFPCIDGMLEGLTEPSRFAVFDVIDYDATWFSVNYVDRGQEKSLYMADVRRV